MEWNSKSTMCGPAGKNMCAPRVTDEFTWAKLTLLRGPKTRGSAPKLVNRLGGIGIPAVGGPEGAEQRVGDGNVGP
ncbi:hypothetical protein J2S70_001342 [Trueperella bonasi]|uniref:Uncharacterized protein n=1 Tax=Trueperella bonasi TaxID=312286 RepID=A0ABT9NHT1_9ACTO|nr:hypothetical protein [Trueperella bonasi]MDP9806760.1 hypothetical protein [Trueperella bonasi]